MKSSAPYHPLREKMKSALRRFDGPLTQELVQVPGSFGLGKVPAGIQPDDIANVTCGFCSVGCNLNVHLKKGQGINITPNPEYPVNLGMACPKGWEALTPLSAPDRATTPLLKNVKGALEPVDWDTAMQVFTLRFKAIQDKHGPESVAWLGTGQIVTEEMAFLGALAKFGMGIVHGDSNTRQCMATSAVAYKQSFGFDAPPYTYKDFEESDVMVFIGSNVCIAHPILWQRVLRNKNKPEIIVVDPRKTETAMAATQHYAIKPKSDLVLLYGLARMLIKQGWIDREFIAKSTTGFAEFEIFLFSGESTGTPGLEPSLKCCRLAVGRGKGEISASPADCKSAALFPNSGVPGAISSPPWGEDQGEGFPENPFTPANVSAATGLSIEQLQRFAEAIHRGKRVSFWWTMGVNQGHESTRTAQAIINLALMTGNIGRPGTGANSITGQCNAMGSRLFSNTSNLLGGRDFLNAAHREKVAEILKIDSHLIKAQTSWAYDQIVDGIASDKIKGLWVIATNSAHSWINQKEFRKILGKLDFLVVQDMYHTTETAECANLILPAAGWGEKEGTFINSERRFGLVKKISKAPGHALSDFNIFKLVSHYWGCSQLFKDWTSPEAVFQIMKKLSRGQPCDITGIRDYKMIDEAGGIQWPFVEMRSAECGVRNEAINDDSDTSPFSIFHSAFKERRLFGDGKFFHADGRAKFLFDPPRPFPDQPDAQYPFVLLTGRGTSAQWHTLTRTGKSDVLRRLSAPEIYVEINPDDAKRLRIRENEKLTIASRRARIEALARVTPTMQAGQVFMPMHYDTVNQLTAANFDPHSRQPSYKACAVALSKRA